MTRIVIPSKGAEDWRRVLADPERHWRDGYSAKSTAESWERAQGVPAEIASLFPVCPELLLAIAEHQVPLPGGGRASQCDVFALLDCGAERIAMAVEAKVDEPFGPTIAEWFAEPSEGKTRRLTAICDWLGTDFVPPEAMRYQLFHRSAAAIAEARRFRCDAAAMIVQSFSPAKRWYEDFEAFVDLLGAQQTGDAMWRVMTPETLPLWLGWADGSGLRA